MTLILIEVNSFYNVFTFPSFPGLVLAIKRQLALQRTLTSRSRKDSLLSKEEENIKGLPFKVGPLEFNFYSFSCLIFLVLRKKIFGIGEL